MTNRINELKHKKSKHCKLNLIFAKKLHSMRILLLTISLLFIFQTFAQSSKENMSKHVYYLADDKLEGRQTGSKGEMLAMDYIKKYFISYDLIPKGEDDFFQPFEFIVGKEMVGENFVKLSGQNLKLEEDYFPMAYSGNGLVSGNLVSVGFGIHAPGLYNDFENKTDLEGKVFLINLSSPDGIHPHSKYIQYTDYLTRIEVAKKFGATGIVFFNTDKNLKSPSFNLKMKVESADLPIIYVDEKKLPLLKNGTDVEFEVNLETERLSGTNVIGYIHNDAPKTVVIGAHYDHLGYGNYGGSRHVGEKAIHNGADDNASGVALMIELARLLKNSNLNNNNYLFLSFSGEEHGLIGSKYFTQNPTIDLESINYMLNFDMVGRLSEDKKLALFGTGTSPILDSVVNYIGKDDFNITTSASGIGASDHTSFYLKDIPAIHFHTANNPDYHKPSDLPHKINYEGMDDVLNYAYRLISELDRTSKLAFTKTDDSEGRNTPRFTVTLGVIPDYMFEGKGMRIDGVTKGKPAETAGMKRGDVVVKMGSINIADMMSYMTALSKFKKGDYTIVEVERDNKLIELEVFFD